VRIFNRKADLLLSLIEKVKFQTYWWLKVYYVLFDYDYLTWRLHPLLYLTAVSYLFSPFCCLGSFVV